LVQLKEATRLPGEFLRDVMAANPGTFRLFGPDETASGRLPAAFEVTNPRAWPARIRRAVTTSRPVIFAFHGYPWLIHRPADQAGRRPNRLAGDGGTVRRAEWVRRR
jgi:phosphoketolase